MLMLASKRRAGFTIVELLIVIVVIAILAAISIVAFQGIQERALNTARVNEARQWERLITMYLTENGDYPVPSGYYCLGEGFPDVDSNGVGDCWDLLGLNRGVVSSHLNTELGKMGTLPSGPRTPVPGADETSRLGPALHLPTRRLVYWISGTGACPAGDSIWNDSVSRACRLATP